MAEAQPSLRRELRLWDLILFNISALAGIRWLAAAAHAGSGSLALWVLAALFFFLPSALVIARLSELFPEEGGMYIWTKRAFGDWHGFLCAWFYFVGNILYFPSLLLAGVTIASYMFGAEAVHLAGTVRFAIPVTLVALWLALLANLVGLRVGKWTSNLGGTGTYITAALLCAFGLWIALKYGSATPFHLVPQANWENLNFWSQIAFAFQGLELGAILGGEIRNPRTTIPKAAWIGGLACAAFYMAGTAAMLALLTPDKISPLTGLAEAGHAAAVRLGLPWITGCFALLVTAGIFGQVSTYIAGNTRLPFAIGLDHYLPEAFGRLHPRWRTPHVSILTQGVLSSVLLIAMQLGETLRAAYQILVDMTVIVSFVPFVYIFGSGLRFGPKVAAASGLLVSLLAIALSLVPPPEVSGVLIFELKLAGGCVAFGLLGRWVFMASRGARAQASPP